MMQEKHELAIQTIAQELPYMTEDEKNYLIGFLEGVAAIVQANRQKELSRSRSA